MTDPSIRLHHHPTGAVFATYRDAEGDHLSIRDTSLGLVIASSSPDAEHAVAPVLVPPALLLEMIARIAPAAMRDYCLEHPVIIEADTADDHRDLLARIRSQVRILAEGGTPVATIHDAVLQGVLDKLAPAEVPPAPERRGAAAEHFDYLEDEPMTTLDGAEAETDEERARREAAEAAERLGATFRELRAAFVRGLGR